MLTSLEVAAPRDDGTGNSWRAVGARVAEIRRARDNVAPFRRRHAAKIYS
jgi:hypothetical protein